MSDSGASKQLNTAFSLFDQANARDPNVDIDDHDQRVPRELVYAQRMSAELARFCPDASEHLQLAARAQHIERWTSPRNDFPEGRTGYKQWRSQLMLFHARRAGELMAEAGYAQENIERVRYLIQKRQLRRDAETQTLEDVICLVFLRHYLTDFAGKHAEEKVVDIIRKTWNKMSSAAQEAALKLPLSPENLALIETALLPNT